MSGKGTIRGGRARSGTSLDDDDLGVEEVATLAALGSQETGAGLGGDGALEQVETVAEEHQDGEGVGLRRAGSVPEEEEELEEVGEESEESEDKPEDGDGEKEEEVGGETHEVTGWAKAVKNSTWGAVEGAGAALSALAQVPGAAWAMVPSADRAASAVGGLVTSAGEACCPRRAARPENEEGAGGKSADPSPSEENLIKGFQALPAYSGLLESLAEIGVKEDEIRLSVNDENQIVFNIDTPEGAVPVNLDEVNRVLAHFREANTDLAGVLGDAVYETQASVGSLLSAFDAVGGDEDGTEGSGGGSLAHTGPRRRAKARHEDEEETDDEEDGNGLGSEDETHGTDTEDAKEFKALSGVEGETGSNTDGAEARLARQVTGPQEPPAPIRVPAEPSASPTPMPMPSASPTPLVEVDSEGGTPMAAEEGSGYTAPEVEDGDATAADHTSSEETGGDGDGEREEGAAGSGGGSEGDTAPTAPVLPSATTYGSAVLNVVGQLPSAAAADCTGCATHGREAINYTVTGARNLAGAAATTLGGAAGSAATGASEFWASFMERFTDTQAAATPVEERTEEVGGAATGGGGGNDTQTAVPGEGEEEEGDILPSDDHNVTDHVDGDGMGLVGEMPDAPHGRGCLPCLGGSSGTH
ncbi:MAG: hypothetical protein RLN62_05535 [Rickettsiales bacterium]